MKLSITKPTLLLDKQKCLRNIERMSAKAKAMGVELRPHFKTHQSAEIGNWFREFGVNTITVSSVDMAVYFSDNGWKDILIAFPFNLLETERYNQLAEKGSITTLVDNADTIESLKGKLSRPVNFLVDIDTGYHRTGMLSDNMDEIALVIECSKSIHNLQFKGFYCHPGHTYKAGSVEKIKQIYGRALNELAKLKELFAPENPEIVIGDTPGCIVIDSFPGVDAITPGNFVFFDLFQHSIGSCRLSDIAIAVACPVVGKYPYRNEIVVHGGAVHFSKDALTVVNRSVFGKLVTPGAMGWDILTEEIYLERISQEHGTVIASDAFLDQVRLGDILYILPIHSCLTANLMKEYTTLEGGKFFRVETLKG